ncbi:MAG: glycosyltransferase family 2 protein [Saprospiraceae bacterium]
MFTVLTVLFWFGLFTVFYAYLGYALLLVLLLRLRKKPLSTYPNEYAVDAWPEVTFVICAYNEAKWIQHKIANSLAIDYPQDRFRLVIVTDGSDDGTPELVAGYPYAPHIRWELLHEPERRGKIAAFQRAMHFITTPFVVSTDANTLVNPEALRRLLRHFIDPQVGSVAGEKRISLGEKDDASSAGEGIYWKYESTLKRWDAQLWTVVGAAGELFAFRREAYEDVPVDTIVEDFYLTMRIAQRGYRVQYEPGAFAVETSSASVQEELKRKIRIAAGSWQAIVRLAPLLNIFKYGLLSFQYLSHRVLRWTLAPALLPIILITNFYLAKKSSLYSLLLAGQLLFYLAALAGYLLEQRKLRLKILFVPYYFCVMNYAQYAGFLRYLRGRQSVLWERVQRAE